MDFYKGFLLWCLVPLGLGLLMVSLYFNADRVAAHHKPTAQLFRAGVIKAGLTMCIIGYIPLCQNIFSVMQCTELYGEHYLSAALDKQCYVGEHNVYFAVGILFVCLYAVGIPLAYFLACRR